MRYCTIAPGLPPSSVLGFGCGSMGGRVERKQSALSLGAALDAGITHFDIARSYGYGDAEALLGEALAGRRERVVVATKFGIAASSGARALRRLKPLAQSAVAALPLLRPLVRSVVRPRSADVHRFSPGAARTSLEESLRALKTDYVDILFLHECTSDELDTEMLDFLATEREKGHIRAYGVASGVDQVAAIASIHGSSIVYQFPNAITNPDIELRVSNARPRITHSPFAGAAVVASFLSGDPNVPPGRSAGAADAYHLMLAYALRANAEGVVVCSMLSEQHLQANLEVVERPRFSDQDIADLTERFAVSTSGRAGGICRLRPVQEDEAQCPTQSS